VAIARYALSVLPFRSPLLYARIDLLEGDGGAPVVLEAELTEPSLFLSHDAQAPRASPTPSPSPSAAERRARGVVQGSAEEPARKAVHVTEAQWSEVDCYVSDLLVWW